MRPSVAVHATEGITVEHDSSSQRGGGHQDVEAVEGPHRRPQANAEGVPSHDGKDHGRGGAGEVDPGAHRGAPGDIEGDYGDQQQCGRLRECDDQDNDEELIAAYEAEVEVAP